MAIAVREEHVITALRKLDHRRWAEVLTFIGYLQGQAEQPKVAPEPTTITANELLASGLTGLWADRTDIDDSVDSARRLRQTAENQRGQRNVAS
ncbi:MAG: hypothetical protein ACOYNY_00145 [Caldilineaceae bacterium]|jgi:hypothetical protein